jgi:hypothetical protein
MRHEGFDPFQGFCRFQCNKMPRGAANESVGARSSSYIGAVVGGGQAVEGQEVLVDDTVLVSHATAKPAEATDGGGGAALVLTAGFAVVAGWADVVCFKAFGSFAALMTGNTVKMGLSVFDGTDAGANSSSGSFNQKSADDDDAATTPDNEVAYYGSILCSYICGVWMFNLIKRFWPVRPGLAGDALLSQLLLDSSRSFARELCRIALPMSVCV